MPYPRYKQINVSSTPYYHVVSRCVRQHFLCGVDKDTGQSFEHRKDWVEERILLLASVFSIGVLAYACMSNHCHLVLCINEVKNKQLTDFEVLKLWHKVSHGTEQSRHYLKTGLFPENKIESELLRKYIRQTRGRMLSISWFMKCLNEYIARRANKEDECNGHFWEGRFKSQPLLDEAAVLSCMAYVDLNPFRAGITKEPFSSQYTSLRLRVKCMNSGRQPKYLVPFAKPKKEINTLTIAYPLSQYIQLVQETAGFRTKQNQQVLSKETSRLVGNIGLKDKGWFEFANQFEELFPIAAGREDRLNEYIKSTERTKVKGAKNALAIYLSLGLKTH